MADNMAQRIIYLENKVSELQNNIESISKIVIQLCDLIPNGNNEFTESEIQDNINRHHKYKLPPPPTRKLPYPSSGSNDSD